jgi:hypothetical protein
MSALSPTKYPHLYAVVSRSPEPAAPLKRHRDTQEMQRVHMAELKAKKAIDRAHDIRDKLEQRIQRLDREMERLQRRKQLEHINDRVFEELERAGLVRADGFAHSVLSVPCPAAVAIDDVQLVPADFMRQPKVPAPAPDRVKIKKTLETGAKVAGCRLTQANALRWT